MFSFKSFYFSAEPELDIESDEGSNVSFSFGVASMQGWRRKQEDQFQCIQKFFKDYSYFGVFDGHGGSEVAIYLKQKLHEYILGFLDSKDEDVELALILGFLSCDLSIQDPEAVAELNFIISESENVDGGRIRRFLQCLSGLLKHCKDCDSSEETEEQKNSDGLKPGENVNSDETVTLAQDNEDGLKPGENVNSDETVTLAQDNEGISEEKTLSSDAMSSAQCLEGVAGPSQGMNKKDDEAISSDTTENSDHLSKNDDNSSEDEEKDNTGGSGFEVLKYLMDDDLEDSDPNDNSYESENEGNSSEDNCMQGQIPIENKVSDENEDFEMEPGVQSGSTATVIVINQHKIYMANVGDSRCVVSIDGKAHDLSVDHTPEKEEERSRILSSGAKLENGRINEGLNLSRAFGDYMYKRNSELDVADQAVTCVPHIAQLAIGKNFEFVIMASDGIWNSISSQEAVDYVHLRLKMPEVSLTEICQELFHFILPSKLTEDGTGCDNMTCMILKINHDHNAKNVIEKPRNLICYSKSSNSCVEKISTSASRGTVIQMAGNDDDDDDCQVVFEKLRPQSPVRPNVSYMSDFHYYGKAKWKRLATMPSKDYANKPSTSTSSEDEIINVDNYDESSEIDMEQSDEDEEMASSSPLGIVYESLNIQKNETSSSESGEDEITENPVEVNYKDANKECDDVSSETGEDEITQTAVEVGNKECNDISSESKKDYLTETPVEVENKGTNKDCSGMSSETGKELTKTAVEVGNKCTNKEYDAMSSETGKDDEITETPVEVNYKGTTKECDDMSSETGKHKITKTAIEGENKCDNKECDNMSFETGKVEITETPVELENKVTNKECDDVSSETGNETAKITVIVENKGTDKECDDMSSGIAKLIGSEKNGDAAKDIAEGSSIKATDNNHEHVMLSEMVIGNKAMGVSKDSVVNESESACVGVKREFSGDSPESKKKTKYM